MATRARRPRPPKAARPVEAGAGGGALGNAWAAEHPLATSGQGPAHLAAGTSVSSGPLFDPAPLRLDPELLGNAWDRGTEIVDRASGVRDRWRARRDDTVAGARARRNEVRGQAWNALLDTGGDVWDTASGGAQDLLDHPEGVVDLPGRVFDGAVGLGGRAADRAAAVASSAGSAIVDTAGAGWSAVRDTGRDVADNVAQELGLPTTGEAFDWVQSQASGLLGGD